VLVRGAVVIRQGAGKPRLQNRLKSNVYYTVESTNRLTLLARMHHNIVALEGLHVPIPEFDFAPPNTNTLTVYQNTLRNEVAERVKDATIIISTTIVLDAAILDPKATPKLLLVAAMSTGTDHVDLAACKARGVAVTNTPGANIETVSEHALSLFFAARRKTVLLHNITVNTSEWKQNGSVAKYLRTPDLETPLVCQQEVCGIVGYGQLGKRLESIAKALGMTVLIADRKGASSSSTDLSAARTPFDEVIKCATVIFLTLPRTPETLNLISTAELDAMSRKVVIVNVARGGIVDEAAIVEALKGGKIAGYGTDVFTVEPASGADDSPLLADDAKSLNITVSPHIAWNSSMTGANLQRSLKETVESWVAGNPQNVIVPGGPQ